MIKGFVVYKSSAGSGKTFTLVREYLAVVLKDPDKFRHVLAVTFTNKAASEMKERVVGYLTALADPRSSAGDRTTGILRDQLLEITGLEPEELKIRSALVLNQIMHHYTEFAVGTIDSFMHRVVRAFAFDLGIPINFEVEIDADELLSRAVDILIGRAGIDPVLTNTLVSFVESKTEDEKSWDIEKDLLKASHHLFREDARPSLDQLTGLTAGDFSSIKQSLHSFLLSYEEQLITTASRAMELIRSAGLDLLSFKGKSSGIGYYFKKIMEGRFEELEPTDTMTKMTASGDLTAKTAPSEVKEAVDTIRNELLSFYEEIQKIRSDKEGIYIILKKVYQNIHQLTLLSELSKILDDFRKEDSIIHISEFNRRIYDFVIKEPVPFIYERLGEKYKHFLIDEFQDTSLQQWHNLLPLVENALSYAHYNMVVGDGKQAIYRFRAGDVEQFTKLPGLLMAENEVVKLRERTLRENYEKRNLEVNYRSEAAIVDFNNSLFLSVSSWLKDEYKGIYDDIVQKKGKNMGGYVRLDFIDSKEEYQALQLKRVLEVAGECTADGHPWSDMAVLCRDNQTASLVARHLLSNGVDVISSESLLVGSAGSVIFVVSFLKVLHRPEDLMSYISALKILEERGRVSRAELLSFLSTIRKNKKEPGRASLARQEMFHILAGHGMTCEVSYLLSLNLFELVEEIARSFSMLSHRDPYLLSFMDIVREQIQKGRSDPDDFLKWWEENKSRQSVVVPEGINAVRVMTIHKAKGLQFPVVIYPFADQIMKLTRSELWVPMAGLPVGQLPVALVKADRAMLKTPYRDLYEQESAKSFVDLVNLLYVALTRPMERLYVISRYREKTTDAVNTVGKILQKWLKEQSLWDEGMTAYTFGERHPASEKETEKPGAVINSIISEPWGHRFLLRMNAPYYWDVEDPERNRRWGNLVHLIFSRISAVGDVDDVISGLVTEGALSAGEKDEISKTVRKVIQSPEVEPYFRNDHTVVNEAEVITADGRVYRPDRLLMKDKQAIVIDFKTGRHREEYKEQLDLYSKVLEDMGFVVAEKVLIYTGREISVISF